ncbi:MAG TPA: hypothetical protein PKK15_06960 [Kouleothrix sp.]|nr:hypothetical protein [Kouleothrix sp.]
MNFTLGEGFGDLGPLEWGPAKIFANIINSIHMDINATANAAFRAVTLNAANLADSIKSSNATLKKINPTIAKASVVLSKNGWWIVGTIPISFYYKIIEMEEQISSEDITRIIVEYINLDNHKRLNDIVHRWNVEPFRRRREIFDQALWAHTNEKYALTTPTLIIHVEGIIREFVEAHDKFTSWRTDRVLAKFKERFTQIQGSEEKPEIEFEELEAILNYYNLKALNKLYSDHSPERHTEPDDINRNAISHGRWTSYANLEISTKMFLLIDMLHSMIHQLQN